MIRSIRIAKSATADEINAAIKAEEVAASNSPITQLNIVEDGKELILFLTIVTPNMMQRPHMPPNQQRPAPMVAPKAPPVITSLFSKGAVAGDAMKDRAEAVKNINTGI